MNILFQADESTDQISESTRMNSYRAEFLFSKTSQNFPPPLPFPQAQVSICAFGIVYGQREAEQPPTQKQCHCPHLSCPFQLSCCNLNDHLGEEWLLLSSKRKVLLVETRRHFEDFTFSMLPGLIAVIIVCFARSSRFWSCEKSQLSLREKVGFVPAETSLKT